MFLCVMCVWSMRGGVDLFYLAKDTEEGDPEDEENQVPNGDREARGDENGGDKVHDTCHGRQGAYDDSVDLWITMYEHAYCQAEGGLLFSLSPI